MEDRENDLNFKMSKKISQLTKVIYQLNCRNEDSEIKATSIQERYENEISQIMSDATQNIGALREALQSKNDEKRLETVVQELQKQHAAEKAAAFKLFDEFKEKVVSNEAGARQSFDDRIAALSKELVASKEEFSAVIAAMKRDAVANSSSFAEERETVRKRKEQELEELVKQYNEKYKKMLAEQLDARDALECKLSQQHQAELAEVKTENELKLSVVQNQLSSEKKRVDRKSVV